MERYEQLQKRPAQKQDRQPGLRSRLDPLPDCGEETYRGNERLKGQTALITGGDSGIGRATAIAFAREGADIAIVYYDEHDDARDTASWVEREGRQCMLMPGDISDAAFCREVIDSAAKEFKRNGSGGGQNRSGLNILVNNAAWQLEQEALEDITDEQLERTFRTDILSFFYLSREALKHMNKGDCIINVTSVTAYLGFPSLIDYSATKGAIVTFTRSLSQNLAKRGIRVNGVAPGPIWTPLIPSTFKDPQAVKDFGSWVPMGRAGQPAEVAPSLVFLADNAASSYFTGQVLHPNGGDIVNG